MVGPLLAERLSKTSICYIFTFFFPPTINRFSSVLISPDFASILKYVVHLFRLRFCFVFQPILTKHPAAMFEFGGLHDTLPTYLLGNDLISPGQHGFLRLKSCSTCMTDFSNKLTKDANDRNSVISIFFDLTTAFHGLIVLFP